MTPPDWLTQDVLWGLAVGSAVMFVGSLLTVPWLVARIPADYFVLTERHRIAALAHRPLLRGVLRILANALGIILILAGIAMLVLPGQGILTIIMGLVLTDFPGKYRFERWLVSFEAVHRPINALRHRAGRQPLLLPDD
ncbi:MAG: PGPGW domain-containing protein [Pseudomonadota bacterium]